MGEELQDKPKDARERAREILALAVGKEQHYDPAISLKKGVGQIVTIGGIAVPVGLLAAFLAPWAARQFPDVFASQAEAQTAMLQWLSVAGVLLAGVLEWWRNRYKHKP